jgi:hypothetical protein
MAPEEGKNHVDLNDSSARWGETQEPSKALRFPSGITLVRVLVTAAQMSTPLAHNPLARNC